MVTITIQQALCPFFIICFIMGLNVHPIKQSTFKIRWIYLSTLYFLIIWFAYIYILFYILNYFALKIIFVSSILIIASVINIFSSFMSVIMNFYYQKRFEICIIKLTAVDDTLEKLGTPKMYQKMHMLTKRIVIGWIIHCVVVNFHDTIYWLKRQETAWALLLPYIINYCLHINTFLDLLFIFVLWYIGTRFDKVNEHVRYLLIKEEYGLKCKTWKKSVIALRRDISHIDNCKQMLWTTMHLHLELCRLTRELNSIFGTQMTLEMTAYLLYLTVLCYYLYVMLMDGRIKEIEVYTWCNMIMWSFLFLMKLCAVNYICESVMIKANKIDKIIHQLTNSTRYADIWKEIYQFSLQVMYHPLKFTGMGLFYFGNDFLRKFCMTIAKFLIIMAQLKINTK